MSNIDKQIKKSLRAAISLNKPEPLMEAVSFIDEGIRGRYENAESSPKLVRTVFTPDQPIVGARKELFQKICETFNVVPTRKGLNSIEFTLTGRMFDCLRALELFREALDELLNYALEIPFDDDLREAIMNSSPDAEDVEMTEEEYWHEVKSLTIRNFVPLLSGKTV